jgi:glyoxylase-like metal-dependent hydrolase (beta-lactamase superfamily II)
MDALNELATDVGKALKQRGWTLTDILITHRHGDHQEELP